MSDIRGAHPSLDELTGFDRGRLQPAERAAIEHHVAACDTCCNRLEAVADDPLVALLRTSAGLSPRLPLEDTCDLLPEANNEPRHDRPQTAPAVPAELAGHSRYLVLGLLGAGGMGVVFKAEHRLMERTVALKVLHKSLTERAEAVERFRQEVKTAARLSHPNIVTAYDAERAGDLHFLVMEFVEGTSLDRLVRAQGPLPIASACHIARQVALGLQHAFERGMVHRDIKPANLLLTPAGQVKVLDFGLARFVSETGGGALTAPGAIVGTPDYVAPEQALDARQADIRADIYGLGCTLYFLLAGRPPFPEGSALQKLMAHQQRRPRPLGEIRDDVPAELVRVLDRMTTKGPAQRYQTPAEVAEELAAFAGGDTPPPLPAPARPDVGRDDKTITDRADLPEAKVSSPRRRNRRPWLAAVLAGTAVLLTAALSGSFWWHMQDKGANLPKMKEPFADGEIGRLGGQLGPFTRAVISSDCRRALVAGPDWDLNVYVWDLDKGEVVGEMQGHQEGPPMGLALSRDGRYALSGGRDATVRLWDLEQGRLIRTFNEEHTAWVRGVDFAGEHGLAVSGDNRGRVLLWDTRRGRSLGELPGHEALVWGITASRSGRLAVSASDDRTARVWDLVQKQEVHCLRGHEDKVSCAVLSSDDHYVLSGSADRTARLWDLTKEKVVRVLRGHTATINALAISSDNRRALSGDMNGTIRCWDLENAEEMRCYNGHHGKIIRAVAFCPDGARIVSAGEDGTFRFWRLP